MQKQYLFQKRATGLGKNFVLLQVSIIMQIIYNIFLYKLN